MNTVPQERETTTTEDDAAHELERARLAQRERALLLTPAERFALLDELCREVTWIAANARRR